MSHYAVIVIGSGAEDQIERFGADQNQMFIDVTDEYMERYENEEVDFVRYQGKLYFPFNSVVQSVDNSELEHFKGKYSDLYGDFNEYCLEFAGLVNEDDRWGYYANPESRWDWYQVGGRWDGFFRVKNGVEPDDEEDFELNSEGLMVANAIKVKNVDLKLMMLTAAEEANKIYDKLEEVLEGEKLPSWYECLTKHGDNIDAARNDYNKNPLVIELNKHKELECFNGFYEYFGPNREAFIEARTLGVCSPYAYVLNGCWYDGNDIGESHSDWLKSFHELLASLDGEELLTIIDCHN